MKRHVDITIDNDKTEIIDTETGFNISSISTELYISSVAGYRDADIKIRVRNPSVKVSGVASIIFEEFETVKRRNESAISMIKDMIKVMNIQATSNEWIKSCVESILRELVE
jgi:hypothetical protein